MVIEMLSSILFTPFLIRTFGQAEYGVYSLVASITAYLALLDLGIGNSLVRYMAKFKTLNQKHEQRDLLAVTLLFYILISVVVVGIGSVLKFNFDTLFSEGLTNKEIILAKKLLSLTCLNIAATLIFSPFNSTIIAYERFAFSKSMAIMKTILRVAISFVVMILGGRSFAVVVVNFCMTLLFGSISILYVILKIKLTPDLKNLSLDFVKEIIGYSAFIFLQMVATQINSMVDQILIGAFVYNSSTILCVYAVGAQINQYFHSIGSNVTGVLMPGIVKLVEQKADCNALLDEMVRIGRIILIMLAVIWSVFIVIGDDFIVLWAGKENAEAYIVACLLITPAMLVMVQSVGSQILWAKNKHKKQAVFKIITAVINVFITYLLIRWKPLVGACIGTAIAVIFGDIVVMNIVFSKDIGIDMKQYYKKLFKGVIPVVVITVFIGIVVKYIIKTSVLVEFITVTLIMIAIYVSIMYSIGMNDYEKNLVKGVLNKSIILKKDV